MLVYLDFFSLSTLEGREFRDLFADIFFDGFCRCCRDV
jgi:hypothetical protein